MKTYRISHNLLHDLEKKLHQSGWCKRLSGDVPFACRALADRLFFFQPLVCGSAVQPSGVPRAYLSHVSPAGCSRPPRSAVTQQLQCRWFGMQQLGRLGLSFAILENARSLKFRRRKPPAAGVRGQALPIHCGRQKWSRRRGWGERPTARYRCT